MPWRHYLSPAWGTITVGSAELTDCFETAEPRNRNEVHRGELHRSVDGVSKAFSLHTRNLAMLSCLRYFSYILPCLTLSMTTTLSAVSHVLH